MDFEEMRATKLLDVLSKFGFDYVLRDFTRNRFEAWAWDSFQSNANVSRYSEMEDCYIFSSVGYDVYVVNGASKVVFWSEDDGCVFKISFKNLRFDYCGLEAEYFEMAKSNKLDEFFAATEFLMDYKGHRIYVAERAEVNYERLSSDLYEKLESSGMDEGTIRDTIAEAYDCSQFADLLFPYYGNEDKINELFEFLSDCGINDLHTGNMGYIEDRLVLIDYSGYRG